MSTHNYTASEKLHITTRETGTILAVVERVEGDTLHVEAPLSADHYQVDLESGTTGTIEGEDNDCDDAVVDITRD